MLRLSGPAIIEVLAKILPQMPPARRAQLLPVRGQDGEILDQALVLFMPGPASFTGEDCAELHVHGGHAVVAAVSRALIDAGARPAEPGEFTKRAFLNRRMDLLEAEGIADLISAQTEAQRRQALRQMQGAQTAVLAAWCERLVGLLAAQEALIDFPDEDLPPEVEAKFLRELGALRAEMDQARIGTKAAMRVREGITIAVAGPPNVGKSTLINALVARDVAITSAIPGTTRDALEIAVEIAGVPVTLIDTAGLRETIDEIEAEGVRRARARAENADLVLWVRGLGDAADHTEVPPANAILIANKIDLGGEVKPDEITLSARESIGLEALHDLIFERVRALTELAAGLVLTQDRHHAALSHAIESLDRALNANLPELRGEDLRLATAALGRISGVVDVEDVLDAIFSRFCIGK